MCKLELMKSKIQNRFFIVFCLVVLSVLSVEAKESSEDIYKEGLRVCGEPAAMDHCKALTSKLFYDRLYAQAFTLQEMACATDANSCDQAYMNAQRFFPEKVELIIQKIVDQCDRDAIFCGVLAGIYKDRRKPALALAAYRKEFDKTGTIVYALELKEQNKSQKEIDAAVEQSCERDKDSCGMALRYFPKHPKQKIFAKKVGELCEAQGESVTGADDCSIVGSFYFKNNDFEKALKYWTESCDYNELTCILILGSEKAGASQHRQALANFCKIERMGTEVTLNGLRKKHCGLGKTEAPNELIDESRRILASFTKDF